MTAAAGVGRTVPGPPGRGRARGCSDGTGFRETIAVPGIALHNGAVLEGSYLSQHWKSRDYFPLRTSRPITGDGEASGGVTTH